MDIRGQGNPARTGLDGLVLGVGPDGRCDDFRLGGATVMRDAASGEWRMWYYCRDREFRGPSTLGTGRIALAVSQDGIGWRRYGGDGALSSVFSPSREKGAFDNLHLGISDMTTGPEGYEMWYFGGSEALRHSVKFGLGAGLGMLPGLATSRDGLTWQRRPGSAPGGALVRLPEARLYRSWPNVFRHEGVLYMQLTEASSDLGQYDTSVWRMRDDGQWEGCGLLQWSDATPGYDEAGMVTRQVLPNPLGEGGRLLMVYTAVNASRGRHVAAAHSDDGIHWQRLYREPIFAKGAEGAWDSLGVAANRLVEAEGRLYLYYYGFQTLGDMDGMRGIGLATAPTGDLRDLRRVAPSPLLSD